MFKNKNSSDLIEDSYKSFVYNRSNFRSEEELRIYFASSLSSIADKSDVKLPEERHEYSVIKGRIDSLYGEVILEYKEPHYIRSNNEQSANIKAINQVKRHIEGIEKRQKKAANRYLGIVFDGHSIIFIRYRNRLWSIDNPIEVNSNTYHLLVNRIFSVTTQGKALIIENLVSDFGIDNPNTIKIIQNLYANFEKSKATHPKVQLLYEQWKILFREVCGYEFDTKKTEITDLKSAVGLEDKNISLSELIYIIHTYYAMFIKILGAETLTYFRKSNDFLSSINENNLQKQLEILESGEKFNKLGINNYIEGDFFGWYLLNWNAESQFASREIINTFKDYDLSSLNLEPNEAKDLIKKVYHYLLPRKLRHSLGEYYTPDWLAEFTLDQIDTNYQQKRFLDPSCGSGTFLVLLIERYIKNNQHLKKEVMLSGILDSIVGIDLNPLAVIAARTNYIIALSAYLEFIPDEGIEIPIYLSDSMLAPLEYNLQDLESIDIPTRVGVFKIPTSLTNSQHLNGYFNLVSESIDANLPSKIFNIKLSKYIDGVFDRSETIMLEQLYEKIYDLNSRGLDGIWTKILKNVFAPIFFSKFDYIVGNPPWINWQSLPEDYRDSIKKYWHDYKIFNHKGLKARLGSAHDDISVLMTYVVADKFLIDDGVIAFVLPQNLFQSTGGGAGFRRFKIKENEDLGVCNVHDFSEAQPFADLGASNKTAVVTLRKGHQASYPVAYKKWTKYIQGNIPAEERWNGAKTVLLSESLIAAPIRKEEITSSWLIADKERFNFLQKLVGKSEYKARKGIDFSLNGLFWGKVRHQNSKLVLFNNCFDIGKKKVQSYQCSVEKDLVYPILRGKNISKWSAKPELYAIVPYNEDGKCIPPKDLSIEYTQSYKYFNKPEINELLLNRGIYQKHLKSINAPKYALYDIGKYTFSPYKVVWKALASGMIAVVIGNDDKSLGNKMILPDHNVLMVPFNSREEAHYFAGILNSAIVSEFVKAYISWFYSSHILEHINIPSFNAKNNLHIKMSVLSINAHSSLPDTNEQEIMDKIAEEILISAS